MIIPLVILLLATAISAALFRVAKSLNSRNDIDREKASPFECGFDPHANARIPFSLRFFLLAIIFIVFDIEIVLLIPTPLLGETIDTYESVLLVLSFLIILLVGLFHEWKQGSLDWTS